MTLMFKYLSKRTQGFTIVELLIVVVVIAILAAITIVSYNGIQQRAQMAIRDDGFSTATKKIMTEKQASATEEPPSPSSLQSLLDSISVSKDASSVTTTRYVSGNGDTAYIVASGSTDYCLVATIPQTQTVRISTEAVSSANKSWSEFEDGDHVCRVYTNPWSYAYISLNIDNDSRYLSAGFVTTN